MTSVSELFDPDLLEKMLAERMVNEATLGDLRILNYSAGAQFSRTWNEVTKQCRGLILRGDEVVARPFPKFFNLSEHESELHDDLPLHLPVEIYEKMDGSLGILYESDDGPAVATRGSLQSEQAQWATAYVKNLGEQVPEGLTLLFEIIYPQNRIVVDYGDFRGLVLLAAIDIETGADVPIPSEWQDWPHQAKRYDGLDIEAVRAKLSEPSDAEGFVLRFVEQGKPSVRAKAKFDEYVRLHRLITTVSSKTIWENMANGLPLDEMLDRVPDEFFGWVKSTQKDLQTQYDQIEREAQTVFATLDTTQERRDLAAIITKTTCPAVLFKMLDGKDYKPLIWKSIRPSYERPFKTDIDA